MCRYFAPVHGSVIFRCVDTSLFNPYPLMDTGVLDCGGAQRLLLMAYCLLLFLAHSVCGQGALGSLPLEWPPVAPWTEQALTVFSPPGAEGFVSFFQIKTGAQGFLDVSITTRGGRKQVFPAPVPGHFLWASSWHPCKRAPPWCSRVPLGPGLAFADSSTATLAHCLSVATSLPC